MGNAPDYVRGTTYRGVRGVRGDDARMVPSGQRVVSTTGEAKLPPSPAAAPTAKTALDPYSPGFAVFVLIALLFVIHARFNVATSASIGTKK